VPTLVSIPAPVADFSATQSSGCQVTAEFQNLSTNADRFLWDFGDGTQSTEANPTHTYSVQKEGKFAFTVRLDAEGPGGTDTNTKTDFIASECVPPPAPKADFFAKPDAGAQYRNPNSLDTSIIGGCNSFTVRFINLSSDANSFLWDFGDGTTSSESNPIHTYSRSGEGTIKYTVQLVVEGPGGKDVASKADYIESQCIG